MAGVTDSKSLDNGYILLVQDRKTRLKDFGKMESLEFRRTDKEAWSMLKKLVEDIRNENQDIQRKDSTCQDIKWVWTVEIIDFWHMNDFFEKTHYFKSLLAKCQAEYFQEQNLSEPQDWALLNYQPVFLDFTTKLLNLLFSQFNFKERLSFWKNPLKSRAQIRRLVKPQKNDFRMSLHVYILEVFWNFMELVGCIHSAEQTAEPKFFSSYDFKVLNCKSFLIKLAKVD